MIIEINLVDRDAQLTTRDKIPPMLVDPPCLPCKFDGVAVVGENENMTAITYFLTGEKQGTESIIVK